MHRSLSLPIVTVAALLAGSCLIVKAAPSHVPNEMYDRIIPEKILATAQQLPSPLQYPQYTTSTDGQWRWFNPDTWTSGFFPATLYAVNERKEVCGASRDNGLGIADWVDLGRKASTGLIPLEDHTGVGHDVGFLSYPFVWELGINPNSGRAKNGINKFAAALAARYSPTVGCTRSWDSDASVFKVIIDNMMNLEVLFQSADMTGNQTLRDIAITHAETTMKNHIRSDGGTWHVLEYSPSTGQVLRKVTSQGYADWSTWARGQSWGINGFILMYERTNRREFLDTAVKMANYFRSRIPSDGIIPWDFDAATPRPADSSAAALASYAMLKLAKMIPEDSQEWSSAAIDILHSITALAWKPSWESVLSNGTVHWPAGNQNTGTVYGDYFYILAGTELVKQGLASC